MKKLLIETNYTAATDSPDYILPIGATHDNHSNPNYIQDLKRLAGGNNFSYMDVGCAGGQSVVEVYEMGNIACGIEGSNLDNILKSTGWQRRYIESDMGDVVSGSKNWEKYKNICLFNADITKQFFIKNENKKIQKFKIITAWDVLEHPKPESIPHVIDNIKNHLEEDGHFVCLINTTVCPHHQCVNNRNWWLNQFSRKGFEDIGFNFTTSPRHSINPLSENDYGFIFKLKK